MLFKVRWSSDKGIYTVYFVREGKNRSDSGEFLIFRKNCISDEWKWIPADECVPVEE